MLRRLWWLKEARYNIIQHFGFSLKITYNHIAMIIYQNNIRLLSYLFCYMHFTIAWQLVLDPKSLFLYDRIISCLKAWYTLLVIKDWFFSKDEYFYVHKSVSCNILPKPTFWYINDHNFVSTSYIFLTFSGCVEDIQVNLLTPRKW